MIPTDPMERAREMARKWVRESDECCVGDTYTDHEDTWINGYQAGEREGFERGIAEAVGVCRKAAASYQVLRERAAEDDDKEAALRHLCQIDAVVTVKREILALLPKIEGGS